MRANKKAILTTGSISIMTFFVCCLLYNTRPFWYDISLACFGSALLGLVVAYSAYSAERRNAMEEFWQESFSLINHIHKIQYLVLFVPPDLVQSYFDEEYRNAISETEIHGAKEKNINWLSNNWENLWDANDKPLNRQDLEQTLHLLMNMHLKNLAYVSQSYLNFININMQSLLNAYARLDFFLANHTIRKTAYNTILLPIYELHNICTDEKPFFEEVINNSGPTNNCLKKVLELNDKLFSEKKDMIYASYADELDKNLEIFRSKIYNLKPKKQESKPIIIKQSPSIIVFTQRKHEETIIDDTVRMRKEEEKENPWI